MGNRNPRPSLLSHPVTCYSAKSAGDAVSLKIKLGGGGLQGRRAETNQLAESVDLTFTWFILSEIWRSHFSTVAHQEMGRALLTRVIQTSSNEASFIEENLSPLLVFSHKTSPSTFAHEFNLNIFEKPVSAERCQPNVMMTLRLLIKSLSFRALTEMLN